MKDFTLRIFLEMDDEIYVDKFRSPGIISDIPNNEGRRMNINSQSKIQQSGGKNANSQSQIQQKTGNIENSQKRPKLTYKGGSDESSKGFKESAFKESQKSSGSGNKVWSSKIASQSSAGSSNKFLSSSGKFSSSFGKGSSSSGKGSSSVTANGSKEEEYCRE